MYECDLKRVKLIILMVC